MGRHERWKSDKRPLHANQSEASRHQTLFSPKGGSNAEQKLNVLIKKRISKLQHLQKMRVVQYAMHNLYGRHSPIDYKPQFNFQENWQSASREPTIEDRFKMLQTENWLYISLYLVLCMSFGLVAWFCSVYRLFGIGQGLQAFVGVMMAVLLIDAILRQCLVYETLNEKNLAATPLPLKQYLNIHWTGLIFFIYLVFLIIQHSILRQNKSSYLVVADAFFVWISYNRFKELYSGIKIKILASKYRNQIMIAQLVGGCLLLVHSFGLLLFVVSLNNKQTNWTKNVVGFQDSWMSRYIYSIYFACTTALTVGYGDITPKNLFETMTVLWVQILGLINIGYIVNQIGRVLSKMNESQELVHKMISQSQTLTKNYQLPPAISSKMKTYIINNQIASNQLNVEEQDSFMRKLNDEIRSDVTSHTQIRTIKSSVFFLCHWSAKFQRKIASKLTRCIYSPQETLTQIHGNQKIYILAKGKLDIEAFFSRSPLSEMKRCLGNIEVKPDKQVHFNVYGYTALISGLSVNLKAIFKDYSICYRLDKEDILKTIVENQKDFEYFHEIKGRIECSRFKQIFEAPNIANTREHYMPNPYFIIKKDSKKSKKSNRRKEYLRTDKREKLCVLLQNSQQDPDMDSDNEPEQSLKSLTEPIDKNCVLTEQERNMKYKAIKEGSSGHIMITSRKLSRRNPKKMIQPMNTVDLQIQEKTTILLKFEQNKHYKFYQPKFNYKNLMVRYNRANNVKNDTFTTRSDRNSNLNTKMIENLGKDLVDRLLTVKTMKNLA